MDRSLIYHRSHANDATAISVCAGELASLGYEISDQTVGNVLQRHGLPPAPERKRTTTWAAFIRTLSLLKNIFSLGGGRPTMASGNSLSGE